MGSDHSTRHHHRPPVGQDVQPYRASLDRLHRDELLFALGHPSVFVVLAVLDSRANDAILAMRQSDIKVSFLAGLAGEIKLRAHE